MLAKIMNGNIADMCADAIVLPANEMLKEGNGCSRALFESAGRKNLEKACSRCIDKLGRLNTGDVVVTPAYHLHAQCILHAVVPKWIDGNSEEYVNLMMTYTNALNQADQAGCISIAFPLLASGNNGYNIELAFKIAMEAINSYEAKMNLRTVFLVLRGENVVNMVRNSGYQIFKVKRYQKPEAGSYAVKIIDVDVILDYLYNGWKHFDKFLQEHPEVKEAGKNKAAEIMVKILG